MALGARRGDVLGMQVRQGVVQLVLGLAFGMPAAFGASRGLAACSAAATRGAGGRPAG